MVVVVLTAVEEYRKEGKDFTLVGRGGRTGWSNRRQDTSWGIIESKERSACVHVCMYMMLYIYIYIYI